MIEVTFTELAFGGDAVGRLPDGKVLFVSGGAPGDRAMIELVQTKPSFARGRIAELMEPGPGRREPPCPLVGECGGCQWQHLIYDRQVELKAAMTEGILGRAGVDLEQLVPSPRELYYRRRARMSWRVGPGGDLTLGFARARSKELVDVPRCMLLSPTLHQEHQGLRMRLAREPAGASGTLVMVEGHDGRVSTSLRGVATQTEPAEVELAPELLATAETFTQANEAQEKRLQETITDLVPDGVGHALELYAGVGALTRALAPRCRRLVATEKTLVAAGFLRRNFADANVEVRAQDAAQALEQGGAFDLVLLDPPREGARGLAPAIAATGASTVIYVSCDPMTLKRDAEALRAEGFEADRAVALDMMPNTYHVEVVARFVR